MVTKAQISPDLNLRTISERAESDSEEWSVAIRDGPPASTGKSNLSSLWRAVARSIVCVNTRIGRFMCGTEALDDWG